MTAPRLAIRYAQVETGTACNYRCVYCPVSTQPRTGGLMQTSLVDRTEALLMEVRPLTALYLNGYDEPTLNPHLAEIALRLSKCTEETVILTNGTRLSRALVESTAAAASPVVFDVHLSATTSSEALQAHGRDARERVRRNLHDIAVGGAPLLSRLRIGMQVESQQGAEQAVERMRAWLNLDVPITAYTFNDRATLLPIGLHQQDVGRVIGCGLQNRPNEWLHINASGRVVLCCQDYNEQYVLGDLTESGPLELLEQVESSLYRSWANGLKDAPRNFLCNKCVHAILESQ